MNSNIKTILFVAFTMIVVREILKSITITIPTEKVSVIEEKPPKKKHSDTIVVTATMYNAVKKQCDSNPFETANGSIINPKKATEHKWVAMSRNLLKRWKGKFDYGDKIRIIGTDFKDGVYTIVDCMNERFKNKIDILETEGVDLYKFENVKIVAL